MADTLTAANQAACQARSEGRDRLDPDTLATVINHYLGALAKGTTDNLGQTGELAGKARTLIRHVCRYKDMILRFATDLSVSWTNNQAERDVRPSRSNNEPPAAAGAPCKASPNSPSSAPTSPPPTNGPKTNTRSSPNSSPPAPGLS